MLRRSVRQKERIETARSCLAVLRFRKSYRNQ